MCSRHSDALGQHMQCLRTISQDNKSGNRPIAKTAAMAHGRHVKSASTYRRLYSALTVNSEEVSCHMATIKIPILTANKELNVLIYRMPSCVTIYRRLFKIVPVFWPTLYISLEVTRAKCHV